jgi:hypothetical protein
MIGQARLGDGKSAESGAQPAPRREPRPARVVQPTVPCEWPQAHATKVESADRLLPLEAPGVHRSGTAIHESRR